MDSYGGFASVYDLFMDETPYEKWADFLIKSLKTYDINSGLVLDLGCGTGTLTELLANAGYDMIGVDNSYEMLDVAMQKKNTSQLDILYLCQDMREFELYGTVAAVVSVCDSINYITEPEELSEVFRLVNNYLDPNGLFIFDFNTDYKYREIIGDTIIAENREEGSFIWENTYDEASCINEYAVTFYKPVSDKEDTLYERIEEFHYQRGYQLEEIKQLIEKSGMRYEKAIDADTLDAVTPESERIYVFAKEQGKSN